MRTLRPIAATVLLGLLAAAPARAQAPTHIPLTDEQIRELVVHRLADHVLPDLGAIYVSVKDRVVTLRGTVGSVWIKDEALKQTLQIDDVSTIVSDLSVTRGVSDGAIRDEIGKRLYRYVFYSIFDAVEFTVKDGVVNLQGLASEDFRAEAIADMVARIPGVVKVANDIKVVDASRGDDRIRTEVATELYRTPMFWGYGLMTSPPIHVVVEGGHVTLVGTVSQAVERERAEHIAGAVPGVRDVDNRLAVK